MCISNKTIVPILISELIIHIHGIIVSKPKKCKVHISIIIFETFHREIEILFQQYLGSNHDVNRMNTELPN
jgi:hypothetical protein